MPLRQPRHWINPETVWGALLALTLATWTDSTVSTASTASTVTAAVVIVIALTLITVLLVLGSYIEITRAPYWLQGLCGLWAVAVFAVIGAGHVL